MASKATQYLLLLPLLGSLSVLDVQGKEAKHAVSCSNPEAIPHGNVTEPASNFTYGHKIFYKCERGFKIEGRNHRRCLASGRWSKKPKCIRTRCFPFKRRNLRNGRISITDKRFFHGSTILFQCNKGYELIGRDEITCSEGRWSSRKIPYCKAPVCPNPGRPMNGWRRGNNFKVGRTVEFHCHMGLTLVGTSTRKCLPNRQWSGSVVVCDDGKTDCPDPGTPVSGSKTASRNTLGSVVTFSCKPGYILVGSHSRKCLRNRKWSGNETRCVDEFEYRVKDVSTTALRLRKTLDRMREHTCSSVNSSCIDDNHVSMRARLINLNDISNGLDVAFVFDGSSSIKRRDFRQALGFAQELIQLIGVTWKPGGTRVAAVCYGTTAVLAFNLGDYGANTPRGVIQKLQDIRQAKGATASKDALIMVRDVVFNTRHSNRKRAMFFITDGYSNLNGRPDKIAIQLWKKYKVEIYAVGVGRKVNTHELYNIAQEEDHVILVKDFKSLKKAAETAVKMPEIDYSPCGESSFSPRARIFGGEPTGAGVWPWQVGLFKYIKATPVFQCGGAILNRRWILTAAHCFFVNGRKDVSFPDSYFIRAGDYDHRHMEPTEQDRTAKNILIHPDYRHSTLSSDIALVRVENNFDFKPSVRPVCLPKKGEPLIKAGDVGYVAGWGFIDKDQRRRPVVLQQGHFKIKSDKACNHATAYHFNATVSLCAGDGTGRVDICKGDSGGSLVHQVKRDDRIRWISKGIVSWSGSGVKCGLKDTYAFFTRVENFVDWIEDNTKT